MLDPTLFKKPNSVFEIAPSLNFTASIPLGISVAVILAPLVTSTSLLTVSLVNVHDVIELLILIVGVVVPLDTSREPPPVTLVTVPEVVLVHPSWPLPFVFRT